MNTQLQLLQLQMLQLGMLQLPMVGSISKSHIEVM